MRKKNNRPAPSAPSYVPPGPPAAALHPAFSAHGRPRCLTDLRRRWSNCLRAGNPSGPWETRKQRGKAIAKFGDVGRNFEKFTKTWGFDGRSTLI